MRSKCCTGCGIAKRLTEYNKSKTELFGRRARCKSCISLQLKEYYKDSLNNRRAKNRISHYKNTYGLTVQDLEDLKEKQYHRCLICDRHEKELNHIFRVDHDHKTGKIRGLLCHNCNCGLGHFRDDADLVAQAMYYLRVRS